jgi:hypothetical protein
MDNIEKRLKEAENRLQAIRDISQLPSTATLSDIIIAVNKITNSIKRRR